MKLELRIARAAALALLLALPALAAQAAGEIALPLNDGRILHLNAPAPGESHRAGVRAVTQQDAYIKTSNTDTGDRFGWSVALSSDGNTLAVGAYGEDSSTTGINSTPDDLAGDSGAVYVFTRAGSTWTQQAYIKASNTGASDVFGNAVSLSSDGNTLAVGAYGEDSSTTGINSTPNESASASGAVYVFTRAGSTWTQQAYVKASNTEASDWFGNAVALSGDGNTLAVGANGEGSSATGVNGNQADNSASGSGAVYVFTRAGSTWTQQAYVKASNTGGSDWFGIAVALSGDGNTLAVGAYGEDSSTTGINSTPNESASASGAVYVFTRAGSTWTQQAYVKASNTGGSDWFGIAVALSGDGNTLAVGADGEDSSATGVNGNQANNSAGGSGAVYVFTRAGTTWTQQAYVKASNTGGSDYFGYAVSLSSDGNTLAVGAYLEDSSTTGINSTPDNGTSDSGAVYVFTRAGSTWTQQAYVKASNTGADDYFGYAVSLSSDGNTLAVGAHLEDSSTTGINSTPDNGASDSGAVYVLGTPAGDSGGDSGGPSIQVYINGSSSSEVIIGSSASQATARESPQGAAVQLEIEVNEIEGRELFFVLNAPALGVSWSYLNANSQWVAVPLNWAAIQPFRLAPPNGRHSLFGTQTLPTGTYEFYLGFDYPVNGHLDYAAGGVSGQFVQRTVRVQ